MENTAFTEKQFSDIYPDGIENHYWNHARNAIIHRFVRKSRIHELSILEIGAGRGVVVKYLRGKGLSVTGVEKAEIAPVSGVGGYFYTGRDAFELPQLMKEKFSVVILLDVLEHIKDPVAFLDQILQNYPMVSHILVTLPARQELWTNYDAYNGHYMRYSLESLKSFTNDKIKFAGGGYFNHILYLVFLLYARLIKQRNTVLKAPSGLMIAVHRLLSWLLQIDYRFLPNSWKGTSLIALFKVVR
jgi:hypothetical protein